MNRQARRRAGRRNRPQAEPQLPPLPTIGPGVVDAQGNIPLDIKVTESEDGGYHLKLSRGDGYVVMDGPIQNPGLLAEMKRLVATGLSPEKAIAHQIMDRVAAGIPTDGQYRYGDH
jgi:hypothetical protein